MHFALVKYSSHKIYKYFWRFFKIFNKLFLCGLIVFKNLIFLKSVSFLFASLNLPTILIMLTKRNPHKSLLFHWSNFPMSILHWMHGKSAKMWLCMSRSQAALGQDCHFKMFQVFSICRYFRGAGKNLQVKFFNNKLFKGFENYLCAYKTCWLNGKGHNKLNIAGRNFLKNNPQKSV